MQYFHVPTPYGFAKEGNKKRTLQMLWHFTHPHSLTKTASLQISSCAGRREQRMECMAVTSVLG
jgi:hypothetical protein